MMPGSTEAIEEENENNYGTTMPNQIPIDQQSSEHMIQNPSLLQMPPQLSSFHNQTTFQQQQ